jgi:EAL and modified HD-GYP domain-containing signal transduction protein
MHGLAASAFYVARQPIFEIGRGLIGYELLYRDSPTASSAEGSESHVMSADVIVGGLLGIGLDRMVGDGLAFVNFARKNMLDETWSLFEPTAVVIELLENVECDAEMVAACKTLVRSGYALALDDYVDDPRVQPLLDLASIVKIDVLGRPRQEIEKLARRLKPRGVRLLAERVETAQMRDDCLAMGFELFQGYLFSRPETLAKRDIKPAQLTLMRLMNLLRDPKVRDTELDDAFRADLGLTYKLLRMVNAAAVGGRGIESIGHAIRLVGRDTLHRWLALILVSTLAASSGVEREVALTAIARARMCEIIAAKSMHRRQADSAFIVGLFSLLDLLLEAPMERIVSQLELSDSVAEALVGRDGPLAAPLRLVEAYEGAQWDTARSLAADASLEEETVPGMYLDALSWANEAVGANG